MRPFASCWLIYSFINLSRSGFGIVATSFPGYISLFPLLPLLRFFALFFRGFFSARLGDARKKLGAAPVSPPISVIPPFHTLEQIRASPRYPHPDLTGLAADKKTHFLRFQTITFLKSHFTAVYPPFFLPGSPKLKKKNGEKRKKAGFLPPPVPADRNRR